MRLIVIKQASDLQSLSARLLKRPSGGRGGSHEIGQATLEQVQQLNPHVDFQRIEAGTVLLLPDTPELKDTDSQSLAGDTFEDFITDTSEGFKAVTQRMRNNAETLDADRAAVNAAVKSAVVKRLIQSDPLLKKQIDEASSRFSDEQNKMQEAALLLAAMQKEMNAEFAVLSGMLK